MITKWLALTVVLALCGCSSSQQGQISQSDRFAWDGLGRDPNLPAMKRGRTNTGEARPASAAELARLHSQEGMSRHGQTDAEEHARISRLMVICRGCDLASTEVNRTNLPTSPTPNRRTSEVAQ